MVRMKADLCVCDLLDEVLVVRIQTDLCFSG